MTSDLDILLAGIRAAPADPRLAGLEPRVAAGVARRGERAVARRSLALAGVVALGIGWIGGMAPTAPAQAASAPVTIGMSDYAPSRLLGE